MKNIKQLITFCTLLILTVGCEDMLDTKVTSVYGDEYTFTNSDKAEGLLINAYISMSDQLDSYNNNFLDAATDNALTVNDGSNMDNLGAGSMSSTSNFISNWSTAYSCFQYINLFMEKCLDPSQVMYHTTNSEIDDAIRQRLTGEAYFLRAYWGMELLKRYGGISADGQALGYPIVTEYIDESKVDSALTMPRNDYEECILQILADCDSAILYLPIKYEMDLNIATSSAEVGRATDRAAHALKSRASLFAASPAYQGVGISEDSIKTKWTRATIIAQEAITNAVLPSLLDYTPLTYDDVVCPTLNTTPSEYLFRKYHNNRSIENRNLPPTFLGQGYTNPSQNLVNAFSMSNGYPIGHALSQYDAQNPYKNRDPRLDATVIYNGAPVEDGGRGLELTDSIYEVYFTDLILDTIGYDDWGFPNIVKDSVFTFRVKAALDNPIEDYRSTRTGYYLRKWVSNKEDMLKQGEQKNAQHMNPMMRVAEVYHNYAEASFEAVGAEGRVANCQYSSKEIMQELRAKTLGITDDPYLTEAAADESLYRALLYNERRVEFAFENHRYFNMRRCKMRLNEPVYGVRVSQDSDGAAIYDLREGENITAYTKDAQFTYVGTAADGSDAIEVEQRLFYSDKFYYCPIPYDEMTKNPYLIDNLGW